MIKLNISSPLGAKIQKITMSKIHIYSISKDFWGIIFIEKKYFFGPTLDLKRPKNTFFYKKLFLLSSRYKDVKMSPSLFKLNYHL